MRRIIVKGKTRRDSLRLISRPLMGLSTVGGVTVKNRRAGGAKLCGVTTSPPSSRVTVS
jgi:hypothetical protein